MKIKLNSLQIKNLALSAHLSAMNKNEPIYSNVLIKAKGNLVKFTAGNGHQLYSFISECEVKEEGQCCINLSKFSDITQNFEGIVNLNGEDEKAILQLGKSKYTISGTNPINFPQLRNSPEQEGLVISKGILKDIIRHSFCFKKGDDVTPFSSIYLTFGSELKTISADGHKLSYRVHKFEKDFDNLLIPSKAISLINRFLEGEESEITIKKDGGMLFLIKPHQMLGVTLTNLAYPDTSKIWIKEEEVTYKSKINKDLFQKALQRILRSSDQKSGQVKLNIKENELSLSGQNQLSSGEEIVDIENILGTELEIFVNGFTLLQFIQPFESFILRLNKDKNRIEILNEQKDLGYMTTPIIVQNINVQKEN